MSMDWWRAHHGISNDSKLCVIALKAKARKCEVGWVWVILLDFASQNDRRGSIDGLDIDQIALMAEISIEQAETILDQFKQRGLIQVDGSIAAWSKRQPARERPDDNSTERVRRFRTKQHDVTPRNAQIREEEIREEENTHTVRAALPLLRKPNADDLNGQTSQRFEEWFTIWSGVRGNAHRASACQAFLSTVLLSRELDAIECAVSYVNGPGADASHGYRPDNFIFEMARDKFLTRWPAAQRKPESKETLIDAAKRMAKERANGNHNR